jgi:integrase/recombinase XerD
MAIYSLNAKNNIYDTLFFWLQEYTKFKAMTLSLKNATEKEVKLIIEQIEKAKNFDELYEIMKKAKKITSAYNYFIINYKFVKWLIEKNAIDDMKDIHTFLVIEFLNIATINKSKSTMENYKNAVINFLKFIEDNIREEFSFKLKVSKWQVNLYRLKDKRPDYLTEEEIDKLLNTIENYIFIRGGKKIKKNEDLYLKTMYKLAIMFAITGGLRISEIANLKLKHLYVNKELDVLEIFIEESKNQKSRIVPIPYSKGKYAIEKDYKNFLEQRELFINKMKNNECLLIKDDYLFITYKCKKLTSSTMECILQKLFLKAGIMTTKKGMHLLRHTHASLFYKKTQDVLLLKERLGHDNIRTTMRYTHLDEAKIKKSADAMR